MQIIFRADPALLDLLRQRTDRDAGLSEHQAARRDLERYYALVRAALPRIPLAQARFLAAVYNGVAVGEGESYLDALRMMPVEVRDALADPPLDIDPADGQALLAHVRAWGPLERAAVIDAIERAWVRADSGDMDDILVAVGLAEG